MTDEQIREEIQRQVRLYMENYGASMESNTPSGDVPLVTTIGANDTIPFAVNENGQPASFAQIALNTIAQIAGEIALNGVVIDANPTQNSQHAVSSGGVFAAIQFINNLAVRVNDYQNFTNAQRAQARTNIDAMAGYIDISDDDRYLDGFTATEFRERKFLYDGRECLVAIVPNPEDSEMQYIAYFDENNQTSVPTGVFTYEDGTFQNDNLWSNESDRIKCLFYHMTIDQWDTLNNGFRQLYSVNGTNRSGLYINDNGDLMVNVASEYGLSRSGDGKLVANIRRSATSEDIAKVGTAQAESYAAITTENLVAAVRKALEIING